MTTRQPLVLLVDDEQDLCMLMQMSLSRMGIKTHMAHHLQQAKYFFSEYKYDACITDLNLPDGSGLDLVKHVSQHYPKTPIAVLTAYGNMEIAIASLKAGAFDFVSKPINQSHLQQLLQKALHVPQLDANAAEIPIEQSMLIGNSQVIRNLRESIKKIARSQAPVFITGESGTGKEVVANLIHKLSNRSDSPFIAINCGAISEDLMESELFGHKKGCFSGATQDKQGLIQAANGGTLFLDEIAELSLAMQAKLLRAVQEKKIRPLGSDTEIEVDFRIISASHQNIEVLVEQGKFRHDLFFRIHVMDVVLPPLRARDQDILILAAHFIQIICTEWQIPTKQLTEKAKAFLLEQHYSGNVRELRNIIEKAITMCDEDQLDIQHLQPAPLRGVSQNEAVETDVKTPVQTDAALKGQKIPEEGLEEYLEKVEKEVLLSALNQTHWNRTLAAKKLGMTFRSLRYRLKKFGLDTDDD
ncbi:sigma-54-dependent transcriptional regulator [Acinetobacter rongchengensis]|uniref:Sigma-54-dependent Fis family transcriptional regulator n=1 Tax=Acinetobacter rongchengensis TaxID=2419601 RepID=A0A3A8F293_9GAMM|nr:sigma-54 dependent transcriptional regulator [Acinetobacter rongchengensis]RKG40518.1 sigma-54-dependent Fis family transcriptional regulator [Acinetobacter rongchengensis]